LALEQDPNIAVFWPDDKNISYAKKLQQYVLQNYKKKAAFAEIGLVIYSKK
jgi:hypothetical protein